MPIPMRTDAESNPRPFDLVVAHYREDLSWLRRVPAAFTLYVYHKGDSEQGGRPSPAAPGRSAACVQRSLPNVGREAHTYLHHLAEHYDDLAEVTVFAQGKPFDHAPDFHKILRALVGGDLPVPGFQWFGIVIDEDDAEGSLLFQTWGGNPSGRPLPFGRFFRMLWGEAPPSRAVFVPGAQFAVHRGLVRQRDRDWYRRALEVSAAVPDAAHCFERTWDRLFGVDGIPARYRARPRPLYFRPIRRLNMTWADVPDQVPRSAPR